MAFADRLIVLDHGRIAAEGAPASVLTTELIRAVWGVEARVLGDPLTVIVDHRPPAVSGALRMRAAE